MSRKQQTNGHISDDEQQTECKRKIQFKNFSNNKNESLKLRLRRRSPTKNEYDICNESLSSNSLSPDSDIFTKKINNETQEQRYVKSTTEKFQKILKITEDNENIEASKSDESDYQNKSDDSYLSDLDNNPELKINKKSRIIPKKKILSLAEKNVTANDPQTPKRNTRIDDYPETPLTRSRSSRLNSATVKTTEKLFDKQLATPKRKSVVSKSVTPSVKVRMLTPSTKKRTAGLAKPKTILEEARAQLHVSAVPKSLPCRETEFNDIFMFLQKKIADHSSGCMYISGVPGTGKTATVNEVIRCLKKLSSKRSLPDFEFCEINGMKMSEPRQSYVQILKQMTGQSTTWEAALKILDKRFTNSKTKKSMTLLLIDELDVLCNKRQDVVYNLFNWPSQPAAQLVVITIANTMDLPERVLMNRVTSRLGLTRLTFPPYNYKQLNEIVIARLNESNAFKSEAVQLVARKVASVSGDARRALDICRRATEITELYESEIVSLQHVNEALTEMISSVKVRAIKHCSEMEKIFLQAVCAEMTRTGVEETTFLNVYKQMEALCSFEGVEPPNSVQGLDLCNQLCTNRLILVDDPRNDILQRIHLNVSSDDIYYALQKIKI